MIRAQNDLYMVVDDAASNSNNDDTLQGLWEGRITRGELHRAAYNICRFLLDTPAYLRMYGIRTELGDRLAKVRERRRKQLRGGLPRSASTFIMWIPSERIRTQKGSMNVIEVEIGERGTYVLEMEVRSEIDNELAQIPMAVSIEFPVH